MHPTVLLYGSTEPLPTPVYLQAGSLSLQYESGFLRYIKSGETEIIRMINYMVRDHNWGTVPMTITAEKIEQHADSFLIAYKAASVQDDIEFHWNCRIEGKEDSSIVFEIEGEAFSTFTRNRLGFTVLHPIENCAGRPCVIHHSDRNEETLLFPEYISPHQPFFDITVMRWDPSEKVRALLQFEGEVFETEDQRNWLDASFKTYCTPLSIPFPVMVKKGEKVMQVIRLQVEGVTHYHLNDEEPLSISIDKSIRSPFPLVGIPLSDFVHDEGIVNRIRALNADFIKGEIHIANEDIADRVSHLDDMSRKLGLPLELALFF